MYAEITKEVFKLIVSEDSKAHNVDKYELYCDTFYSVDLKGATDSTEMLKRENHASRCTQYFIRDINA